jgi:hypothetical protein
MIVNLVEQGWEVIYHRAHALLAAQIAGHWHSSEETAHRVETVAAISHHDDLEREWEGNQLTEVGAPLDFGLDSFSSVEQLRRHVNNALYRDRWVALLTSMHLCYLNQGQDRPGMADFLQEQKALQQDWRQSLGISSTDLEQAYDFMRWCDRLSLILCQRQLPDAERALEINKGPKGKRYDVMQRSDNTVQVIPWPFDQDKFTVRVDAVYLSQLQFDSNEALISALQEAPIQTLAWTFLRSD